jgi:putative transposase
LDHAALLEVLEAMRAAEVDDSTRTAAQTIYKALTDAELTHVIGAGPWQRTAERPAVRNGVTDADVYTTASNL